MWIDIAFLVIAGYAFYRGYKAGIIRTVFMIVSVLVGLLVSMRFAAEVTAILQNLFATTHPLLFLVGFLLTFLVVMGLVRWLSRKLEEFLESVRLDWVNEVIGGALYGLLATILLASVLGLVDRADLLPPKAKKDSMTWPLLQTVPEQARVAYEKLEPVVIDFWTDSKKALDQERQSTEPQ